ncbi:MAG: hypothetical protein H0T76_04525 [Nannocystis sp.]|nr:hypothetical protein [Nannocystis sp.]MBA3545728.1 hypothetical protein [Nannocystis sp.]
MLATALFLVSSPKFATLILCWLLGAGIVTGLFFVNRRRIRTDDSHM